MARSNFHQLWDAAMEELRKQYPNAFEKEYDPVSGLRFNAWVEGSIKQVNKSL